MRLASVSDHKKVSDAILAGDAAAAESAMRDLIQEALDLIKKAESAAQPAAKAPPPTLRAPRQTKRAG